MYACACPGCSAYLGMHAYVLQHLSTLPLLVLLDDVPITKPQRVQTRLWPLRCDVSEEHRYQQARHVS